MLYLFVPLYQEGAALIEKMKLKKRNRVHGLDSFEREDGKVLLTIMGTGKDNAVYAVSSLLAIHPVKEDDFVILYGSAAGISTGTEGLYQAVRADDLTSRRTYYPDPVWNTGIREAVFETGMNIMREEERKQLERSDETVLYDMESAGVFFAAMKHIGPHQILLFRFVSDHGERIDSEALAKKAGQYADQIMHVCQMLEEMTEDENTEPDDTESVERFSEHIHASTTMRRQLDQLAAYAQAAGLDMEEILKPYLLQDCASRQEGKKVLHAVEEDILDA